MTQQFVFQLHVSGPEVDRAFRIPHGKILIGRQPGSTLPLKHFLVSRQHALLECRAEGCRIMDLDSANGTLLNDEPLPPQVAVSLSPNAVIQIGPFTLTYRQTSVEVETPPPPPQETEEDGRPPAHPPSPSLSEPWSQPDPSPALLPGLSHHSTRLLSYLPGIYHTDFMSHFLALFESILIPIEWNVDNFDLYLDPKTAPPAFLPWLTNWFSITFDDTWRDEQRRTLLVEAHQLYARRGTKWALRRVLEIYTGHAPQIDDHQSDQEPFTFIVTIPLSPDDTKRDLIERLIDAHKPAHTSYKLRFETRQ